MSVTAPSDILPHDDLVERSILGALFLEPARAVELANLRLTAFYAAKHRVIFRAFAETLARHGTADPVLTCRHLIESGRLDDAGGPEYLIALRADGWAGAPITHYAGVLADLEARRDAITGTEAAGRLARREGVEATRAALEGLVKSLTDAAVKDQPIREIEWSDLMTGEMPAIPWQVQGYVAEGDFAVIAGEWGSGKSLLCADLALSLALGTPWLGAIQTAGGPYRLLYIDEENGLRLARYRMRQLLAGREASHDVVASIPITYTARNGIKLVDDKWLTWIRRHVERTKTTHLMLDSLIRFHRNDENSSSDANAFFMDRIRPLMDDCGLTVISLDHMGKPSKERTDPGQRVRGTSEKPGEHDNLLCVSGSRDVNTRTLTHEKTRWDELMLPKTTKWTIADDKSAAWITCEDEAPEADDSVLRIIELGGDAGRARKEIVQALEARGVKWAARNATNTLGRLHGKGIVRRRKSGRDTFYWLAADAPEDAS